MKRKKPSYSWIRNSEEINEKEKKKSEKESYAILSATAENCLGNAGIHSMDMSCK